MTPIRDIMPGFPALTAEDVTLFQRNNARLGLVADGIMGPKTRAQLWREPGLGHLYTVLSWHRVKRGGAVDLPMIAVEYYARASAPLQPAHMARLVDIISAEGKTGLGFMSTQDGITWGFRRYAARSLRGFIDANSDRFRSCLGAYGLHVLRHDLEDAPNNGWPSSDPALRHGLIEAARDRVLGERQLADFAADVEVLLTKYPWRHGRLIALAVRALNSAPSWVRGLPRQDDEAYTELRRRYLEHRRGASRVGRIEKRIGAAEVWR